jgi:riboflavin kinase/FMN adenylyltransferase
MVNIGQAPTFHGESAPVVVEAHIPGIDEDLYGEEIEIQFFHRIRDEMKFAGVEELVARLELDRKELDRLVAEVRAPC